MNAVDSLRMPRRQRKRYARAKVAALRAEAPITEAAHQRHPKIRDLKRRRARLRGRRRKREARQRRHHHIERIRGISAERRGIAEPFEQRLELDKRTGPTMRDDERIRRVTHAAPMNEMHALSLHIGDELRLPVQALLGRAPVEPVRPIVDELAQPCRVDTLLPRERRRRGRPARCTNTSVKIVDVGIRHGDMKRFDLHGRHPG